VDLVDLIDDSKALVIVSWIRMTKIDNYQVGPGQDLLSLGDEGGAEVPEDESVAQRAANDFSKSAIVAQKGNMEQGFFQGCLTFAEPVSCPAPFLSLPLEATHRLGRAPWVSKTTRRGTAVVVQRGYLQLSPRTGKGDISQAFTVGYILLCESVSVPPYDPSTGTTVLSRKPLPSLKNESWSSDFSK